MTQKFEYPMYSPHAKAKLYKRFTADKNISVSDDTAAVTMGDGGTTIKEDGNIITVQHLRYALKGKFKWVESTAQENNGEQPLQGLIVESSYITIKTNSLLSFSEGDIIELPKSSPFAGLWIVQGGATADVVYTPKPVQTYQYLPLSTLG